MLLDSEIWIRLHMNWPFHIHISLFVGSSTASVSWQESHDSFIYEISIYHCLYELVMTHVEWPIYKDGDIWIIHLYITGPLATKWLIHISLGLLWYMTGSDIVMSHVWISYVARMNESWHTCHTYEWVMAHFQSYRVTCMSHVKHMDKPYLTYEWVMGLLSRYCSCRRTHEQWYMNGSFLTYKNESCHTYECAMARMSHISHMNESWDTCHDTEAVDELTNSGIWMDHFTWIRMSHVSHMNESWDTCHDTEAVDVPTNSDIWMNSFTMIPRPSTNPRTEGPPTKVSVVWSCTVFSIYVRCSVLQRVAVCCSVEHCLVLYCVFNIYLLQCVAVCCSVFLCFAVLSVVWSCTAFSTYVCCSVLQWVAVCCSVVQFEASFGSCTVFEIYVCRSVLQWFAVCCSDLQWFAVICSVLQWFAVICSVERRFV